ncbi:hypothetical protein [Tissierella praeacuta]|uniref:hypothetical protein n=1 Tax=Tissierella praeacuta TaxID=43131 RepID=UPI001C0F59B3|nr:hypothetical protein [Tissierella praeacuta]MBU5257486.1 hypothetical protein [Tissierella praeacuta]
MKSIIEVLLMILDMILKELASIATVNPILLILIKVAINLTIDKIKKELDKPDTQQEN